MKRLAIALLITAAVFSQIVVNVPNSVTTGQTKCSLPQNFTLSAAATSTLTMNVTWPSGFYGFLQLDGAVTNTTTFSPSKNYSTIVMCSDSRTSPEQTYSFQLSISNTTGYSLSSSALPLTVSTVQNLTIDQNITVPRAGCSNVYTANLSSAVTELNVTYGLTGSTIYLVSGTNPINTLVFSTTTSQDYQVCAYDNATTSQSFNPSVFLSGASSPVVSPNFNLVNFTVGAFPNATITVDNAILVYDTTNNTYFNLSVTSNVNGYFLYYIQELATSGTAPINLTLSNVTSSLATGKTTVQSQADYLSYLYSTPRNMYIGNISVNATNTSTIQVTNYFPGTSYNIGGFFQTPSKSLNGTATSAVFTLSAPSGDNLIMDAIATFDTTPTAADRQVILCWFETKLNSKSTAMITNSYGERCSLKYNGLFFYNGSQYT